MAVTADARRARLETRRGLKMARSVHAYVRGSTEAFYRWLEASPTFARIPQGPEIWICGDCHLGNLGPLADADGAIDVQIRDLDQSVIANPAYDLIRLGLSLETAARSSDLPGVTTAHMIEAMIDGYARAMTPETADDPPEPNVVRSVRRMAAGRRWRHLAKERIHDVEPNIPTGKRFWKLTPEERSAIEGLFADPAILAKALDLAGLGHKGRLRVVDAAYWRKGCSSLGKLRYAVLLGVSAKHDDQEYLALIDIKEAGEIFVPVTRGARAAMPSDAAERVVAGARALSPNLGERMIAARLLDTPVVMRELAPQDLKIEVAQFSRKEAVKAANYLAFIVGVAHARQMSDAARVAWRRVLMARDERDLDAPSWLWRSVVDLAGTHETAYLDHCRTFALCKA